MIRKLSAHARGNAVAYAALFVALGGTAFAAASALPANSVGTPQLKNGAVTGPKVAANTLTGAKIKESTLGVVPNAAHLGGRGPSAYQRRIATGCSSGEAMRAVDSTGAPTCQAFGQGTITQVSPGSGLSGGASSGNATLSANPSVVQFRVGGSCGGGKGIGSIDPMGSVTCSSPLSPMMGGSAASDVTTSEYLAPVGVSAPTASLAIAQVVSPAVAMTASNLQVRLGTAPGMGSGWIIKIFVNGSAVATPNCKVLDLNTTCTDTLTTGMIPSGALLAVGILVDNGMPNPTTVSFGWTAGT
ncbi:MAG: hypothetical protein ACJ764_14235 [Solirubrobacteraceae bacterium]